MRNTTHIVTSAIAGALILSACTAPAEAPPAPAEITDAEVAAFFEDYVEAWNTSDAEAFGDLFTANAEQLVWTGMHMDGKDAIIAGHEDLFAGGPTQMRTDIVSIKHPAPGVTTVLVGAARSFGPGPIPDDPMAMPFFVLVREDGEPRIASLHNMMLPSAWPMIMGGGPPDAEGEPDDE